MRVSPSPVVTLFTASLVLHLVAAHCGVGYYHPDEHFQILEFGGSKLGLVPVATLPWEYAAHARPWLLPAFFRFLAGAWRLVGVENPFVWAESLRVVAGLLAWASHLALYLRAREWVREPARRLAMAALFALLWYFPLADVRPSSDSFSCSWFVLALVIATGEGRTLARAALAGVCLGIAFECRFQTALLAVGLAAWLVVRARWPWRSVGVGAAAFAAVLVLGRVVDRWGYGEWVFSPWAYFRVNLIEGRSAQWGTSPPWGLVILVGKELPPLGALAIVVALAAWWRHRGHVLTWTTLPFILVHALIGHKELRFLAPVGMVLPVMAVLAWPERRVPKAVRVALALLATEDVVALVALTIAPLRLEFRAYEALYDRFPDGVDVYAPTGKDPFEQASLPMWIFRRSNERVHLVPPHELDAAVCTPGAKVRWRNGDDLDAPPAPCCRAAYRSLPPRLVALVPRWVTSDIHGAGWDECDGRDR